METAQTTDELRRLEQRVTDLETANTALRDDSDAQEQYSRRNCLLVHGIPEGQTDTTDAVLSLCNSQLGLELNRGHIDRSHRLGYRSETTTAADSQPKPRPVIVKLTSYETRKPIYTNKRKLKGTRFVVTENLTKRRAELLRKARTIGVDDRRENRVFALQRPQGDRPDRQRPGQRSAALPALMPVSGLR